MAKGKIFVGYVSVLQLKYIKIRAEDMESAKKKLRIHCDGTYDAYMVDKVIKYREGGTVGLEPGEQFIE